MSDSEEEKEQTLESDSVVNKFKMAAEIVTGKNNNNINL